MPAAPAVPIAAIVAASWVVPVPTATVWPTVNPATLATFTLVAPTADAAARVVPTGAHSRYRESGLMPLATARSSMFRVAPFAMAVPAPPAATPCCEPPGLWHCALLKMSRLVADALVTFTTRSVLAGLAGSAEALAYSWTEPSVALAATLP